MTAADATIDIADSAQQPSVARGRRTAGWRIVARKEMADHVLSARFGILILILGLIGAASVYAAASALRDAVPSLDPALGGIPALFLRLFTVQADPLPFSFVQFVAFIGPPLGIAFGFDAINGERSQSTLPRLVSQPIHRDDIINGKYAAGLGVIAIMLTVVVALVAGYGILRLGIVPSAGEVARMVVWLLVAVAYIGVWLAFAILCSVSTRRAATAALLAFALWLVVIPWLFFSTFAGIAADAVSPTGTTQEEQLSNAKTELALLRLSPYYVFQESTAVLLDPEVGALGVLTAEQVDRALLSELSLIDSILVAWPQITALIAATVVVFAVSYVVFMRQEIRA
jgi:ABC-2 type transport system permease protein